MRDKTTPDDTGMAVTSADVLGERMERLRELTLDGFVEGKIDFDWLNAGLPEFVELREALSSRQAEAWKTAACRAASPFQRERPRRMRMPRTRLNWIVGA